MESAEMKNADKECVKFSQDKMGKKGLESISLTINFAEHILGVLL